MKLLISSTLAVLLTGAAHAASLTLTVNDIADHTGTLRAGLFNADGYEGGAPVTGVNISVESEIASATIEGIEPGTYAIKLYHDVDDDGEMATNPFGLPTEPFAFSNNAQGRFGPAKWDAAKFEISGDGAEHTISMK